MRWQLWFWSFIYTVGINIVCASAHLHFLTGVGIYMIGLGVMAILAEVINAGR
jgi:hypothetical protein